MCCSVVVVGVARDLAISLLVAIEEDDGGAGASDPFSLPRVVFAITINTILIIGITTLFYRSRRLLSSCSDIFV